MQLSVGISLTYPGSPASLPGAAGFLESYSSGGDGFVYSFAKDGTDEPEALIVDSGTPANDLALTLADDLAAFSAMLTYTNPSQKNVLQADGEVKYSASNQAIYSEDFTQSNYIVLKAAKTDAETITEDSGTGTHVIYDQDSFSSSIGYVTYEMELKYVDRRYCRLSAHSGGYAAAAYVDVDLLNKTISQHGSVSTSAIVSSTILDLNDDGWMRVTLVFTHDQTSLYVATFMRDTDTNETTESALGYTGGGTASMKLRKKRLTQGPSVSTYLPTTTSAIYALPIEYNSSGNAIGVLAEPAATNLCLHSNDLTDAAWTAANMTTAKTATGPGNRANEATTVTATAANATVKQSITDASAARVTAVYLKRRTGTGNVDLTMDDGSTWATQAITTSWVRYELATATAANPIVGLRLVTDTDAVDVALFQHELGTVATSPIVTIGSTATRAKDQLHMSVFDFPFARPGPGMLYVEFNVASVDHGVKNWGPVRLDAAGTSDNSNIFHNLRGNEILRCFDAGGSLVGQVIQGTVVAGTDHKIAAVFATDDFAASFDGAAVGTDTSGTHTATSSYLRLGHEAQMPVRIKKIAYIPERVSNARLEAMAT